MSGCEGRFPCGRSAETRAKAAPTNVGTRYPVQAGRAMRGSGSIACAVRLLIVTALIGTGCQWLVQTDERQCNGDSDCTVPGGPLGLTRCVDSVCTAPAAYDAAADAAPDAAPVDPKWGCLGNVRFGTLNPSEPITFRFRFVSLFSEAGVPDLLVRACKSIDVGCTSPIATADRATDANGYGSIRIPKWFDGYLEAPPPASFPKMMPALVWLTPLDHDSDPNAEIVPSDSPHMMSEDDLVLLLAQAQSAPDPTLGHIIARTRDCTGASTAGVAVHALTTGVKTVQFYLQGRTPSQTASATDTSAIAGFMNLPVGYQSLTYSLTDGRRVGTRTALSRAGWITFSELVPSP